MLCFATQDLVPYEAFFLCKITIPMGTIWEPESGKYEVFHSLHENTFSERKSYVLELIEVIPQARVKFVRSSGRVAFVMECGV